MLEIANSVDVGPRLLRASDNFILMELLEGELVQDWMTYRNPDRDKFIVVEMLRDVLNQCFRLDKTGLDHGELSQARKHILVGSSGLPKILDFETASITRKPSNLSSLSQYLFVSSPVAHLVGEIVGKIDLGRLREALAYYKQYRDHTSFMDMLRVCHLS